MPSSGGQTCALDRKSTRLNSSHTIISYAVFCLKKQGRQGQHARRGRSRLLNTALGRGAAPPPHTPSSAPTPGPPPPSAPRGPHHFFFFNDPAATEIYTLSLHDALPINDTATTEIYPLSLHDALPISVVAVS